MGAGTREEVRAVAQGAQAAVLADDRWALAAGKSAHERGLDATEYWFAVGRRRLWL